MEISFIVPTLNEVDNITAVLGLIRDVATAEAVAYEVIFVDDSSTDGTLGAIESEGAKDSRISLVRSPNRRGLGNALNLGVAAAKGSYAVFLDCDVSVSAPDLARLIAQREPGEMVIGSRYLPGSKIIGAPLVKVLLSKLFNRAISASLGLWVSDSSHSLRIFPTARLPRTQLLTHPGFFWEVTS
ncbi:MAG: glycosyltransferase family 2 protein, partial [Deltaproteobacteria bacterium]|nr:glycosyltransferase family 2 protein [Deltaproteobacteria bacterium]